MISFQNNTNNLICLIFRDNVTMCCSVALRIATVSLVLTCKETSKFSVVCTHGGDKYAGCIKVTSI